MRKFYYNLSKIKFRYSVAVFCLIQYMRIAIIKTGGKQYNVQEGKVFKFEKIIAEEGKTVKFDTLLIADENGADINLGKPSLGEKVEGKVLEHGKGDKVSVIKYKRKVRYRKNVGHRQLFTKVEITLIT